MPNLVPYNDRFGPFRSGGDPRTIELVYDAASGMHVPVTDVVGARGSQKLLGPGNQLVKVGPRALAKRYDFSPSAWAGMVKRAKHGAGLAFTPAAIAIEAAFIPAIVAGSTITGAAQWGAPTGLSEDYVGGAVYGYVRGAGAGIAGATGGITGAAIGGAIGAAIGGPFAPVTAAIGAAIGGITGNITGEMAGARLMNDPARRLGLAARGIARTARAVDRIQFGGNFVDTRGAYTMRQHAVQEMSASMLNARQFLGNEAIFLHER